MPPSYVKGYVKRGKSDAIDAWAIYEAVSRPTMRFVPMKTAEQQSILMARIPRALIVRKKTVAANALRAHLAEFGPVANPGITNLMKMAVQACAIATLPPYVHGALETLIRRMAELTGEICALDDELKAWSASNEASQRLAANPGIDVITATALAATVSDPDQFSSGRQFAA